MKSIAVSGGLGKDVQVKIDSVAKLPTPFQKHIKKTLGFSKIPEVYGLGWNMDKVWEVLEERAVQPHFYSYGGRAPNVAYGIGRLGGDVRLITTFGDDLDEPYPGFYDDGYLAHLRSVGVKMNLLDVEIEESIWGNPDKVRSFLKDSCRDSLYTHEALRVKNREIPTVVCVKDATGLDFYYIDDIGGVNLLDLSRPAPNKVVEGVDIVFVTSSERSFMREVILEADRLGREVTVDIGSYEVTSEYLRETVPCCNIIFGNTSEIQQVLDAFDVDDVPTLFDQTTENLELVILEDKIEGVVNVFSEDGTSEVYGPIRIEKKGNSVGCCDGIAAGFLSLYQRGADIDLCVRAGLLECAAIWEIETIHGGLLNKKELIDRYLFEFRDSSRIEKILE